jgi:NTE family protein
MDQPSNAAADEPLSDAAPKGRDQVYLPCPAGQAAQHAAFTWGVLDRLLEDERIAFEGISAASARAINAAVFAGP